MQREETWVSREEKWEQSEEKWEQSEEKWLPRQKFYFGATVVLVVLGMFGKFPLYYSKKRIATNRYRNVLRGP